MTEIGTRIVETVKRFKGDYESLHDKATEIPVGTPVEIRKLRTSTDNEPKILCPVCGFDYVHQQPPMIYDPETMVVGLQGIADGCVYGKSGGLYIPYEGECGHLFFVVFTDHKGQSFQTTVRPVEPLHQEDLRPVIDAIMETLLITHECNMPEHRNRENPVAQVMERLIEFYGRTQMKPHQKLVVSLVAGDPRWGVLRKRK